MKSVFLFVSLFLITSSLSAQNTSEKIIGGNEGLIIGGYGEVHGNFYSIFHKNMGSNCAIWELILA